MLFKHVVVTQPGNGNILNHCSKELYLKRAAAVLLWLLILVGMVFQKHLYGRGTARSSAVCQHNDRGSCVLCFPGTFVANPHGFPLEWYFSSGVAWEKF